MCAQFTRVSRSRWCPLFNAICTHNFVDASPPQRAATSLIGKITHIRRIACGGMFVMIRHGWLRLTSAQLTDRRRRRWCGQSGGSGVSGQARHACEMDVICLFTYPVGWRERESTKSGSLIISSGGYGYNIIICEHISLRLVERTK